MKKLLIANRGEIAIRVARAAAEVGLRSVAVYSGDDAASLHLRKADDAVPLPGTGAAAYLDIEQIVAAALAAGCDALHPGYGFLSENAALARRCAQAGIVFVGPSPEVLALLGDKLQARALAQRCKVPVLPGTLAATTALQASEFFAAQRGAVLIKAVAGGGGRGIRAVHSAAEVATAHARCESEALKAFGSGDVYVERLVARARHIEVQIVGDGSGAVMHLGERECSLQRRHQKLIEIAPSPSVSPALREQLTRAALALASELRYRGVGTFEFLVDLDAEAEDAGWYFIEANPRLQVEHTVTEMVTGIDIVQAQLRIAAGATLAELGLDEPNSAAPTGYAMQLRINMETMGADGVALPAGGTLRALDWPGGPGVRVDACAYSGYTPNPRFDSLLAKLVVHSASPRYADVVHKAYRALCELQVEGVPTNQAFLQSLLLNPEVQANRVDTRFVETHAAALLANEVVHPQRHALASTAATTAATTPGAGPAGCTAILTPMDGILIELALAPGAVIAQGEQLAVIEAMKMEHLVLAPAAAQVREVCAAPGDAVHAGQPLLWVEDGDAPVDATPGRAAPAPDHIRADLAEARERHALGLDARRFDAVAKRHATGLRTARENIADLVDAGSFIEYGALAIAAQRGRRSVEDLIRNTPADGMVTGLASVNGAHFDAQAARCAVLAYDYTVLAGTQGMFNHKKTDRLFQLAEQWTIPVVLFAEGGGGRPGDTDFNGVAGLDVTTFHHYARLSGKLPRVGVVAGRCFAGNAALLGCGDVIIATRDSSIGMGGPAMIEGGGLGVVAAQDVGPASMQAGNGVIDVLVDDEAAAVRATKQYLSYLQGTLAEWQCADQRVLRHCVPENRVRAYDMRGVIELLCDTGSVLELRAAYGTGMLTALVRIEGKPLGLIANNPRHLGGAIDADACDKAARFMQLCDAFALPIVSLCDTPGFMVGVASEQRAMVRHTSRLFVTAASLRVPIFTLVLRKGYGLGAQAMAGGSFAAPFFTIAWPSGEFGAMGLEGSVRLGFRKELEAAPDATQRSALFDAMVVAAYERGKALNMASYLEIDAVIDPAESRAWLTRALATVPPIARGGARFIDTW